MSVFVLTVTALMGIGLAVMMAKSLYVPCLILGIVWLVHVVYFVFGVRTLKVGKEMSQKEKLAPQQ